MSNGPPPADFEPEDIIADLSRRPSPFPAFVPTLPDLFPDRPADSFPSEREPSPENTAEALDRVLERWGFANTPAPNAALLSKLHTAYLMNVPFENATKLIRMVEAGSAALARRSPHRFWSDHLEHGTGGTCFAASSAFRALLERSGFRCRYVFCRLPREKCHAHVAILVDTDQGAYLVDVGYALPAPIPLPKSFAARRCTPYYDAEVRRGPDGRYLVLSRDDRGTRFRYGFGIEPVSDDAFDDAWNATFDPRAPYMQRLALGRFTSESRYIYKPPDRLYLVGRSRQRSVRFDPPGLSLLAAVFRIPVEILVTAERSLAAHRRRAGGS